MKALTLIPVILTMFHQSILSQNYPIFGDEIKVDINGLTFDAMEPFISPDGNVLFFNSLNSGGNTNLYYATKVSDSVFSYVGLVSGTYDPSPNHLDAVASMDTLNNFFWTSLRDYPAPMENLHRGVYAMGNVSDITRVYGDFNIFEFNYPYGWLIMDASINDEGSLLYYCNAQFDFSNTSCIGAPCDSKIGVAQKTNDSTFNKLTNSEGIFSNVNDTVNYILYAPQVTTDGLELYFTRLLKTSYNTEICVSVRNSISDTFSLPNVIYQNLGFLPEAPSLTSDKQKLYYHQKDETGVYRIYLRNREGTIGWNEDSDSGRIKIYPNPADKFIQLQTASLMENFFVEIYSIQGERVYHGHNSLGIDISNLAEGIYFVKLQQNGMTYNEKFIKI